MSAEITHGCGAVSLSQFVGSAQHMLPTVQLSPSNYSHFFFWHLECVFKSFDRANIVEI